MKRMEKRLLSLLLIVLMLTTLMVVPSIAATGSVDWDPRNDDIFERTFIYWNPAEGGYVTFNNDSHWVSVYKRIIFADVYIGGYDQGSFTATANPGYVFSGWSYSQQEAVFYNGVYAFSESGNTLTVNLVGTDITKTATANFTPIEYTVKAEAGAGGSAAVSSADGDPYYYNEEVTFTATPESGYVFAGWYDGSTLVSNSATYSVSITGDITLTAQFTANAAPEAADTSITTDEDTPCSLDVSTLISDTDGDTLTCSISSNPLNGSALINGTVITYTPNANFYGSDSFKYAVEDGKGGLDTGVVSVTVNPVNDLPVAGADFFTTGEDTALTISFATLLSNDYDVDGETLSITSYPVSSLEGGTLTLSGDGTGIVYEPAENFNGLDSFEYGLTSGSDSISAMVTITVNPVNDNPIAFDDYVSTYKDTSVSIFPTGNDDDYADTYIMNLKIIGIGTPANGTATQYDDWNIEYVPNTGFTGSDSFEYTIEDDGGATATAMIHVTVNNPSLTVTKTADDDSVYLGDTVKYTITITNNGDVDCDYIEFYDDLLDTTITCGSLGAGKTYTYEYTMVMDQLGDITNTVTVTGCWGSDEGQYLQVSKSFSSSGTDSGSLTYEYKYVDTFAAEEVVTVSERPVTPPPPSVTNYSLTIAIEGSGTVLPGAGTYVRSSGSIQILQVSAAAGFKFDGWAGANGSEVVKDGSSYSIIINGNKTIIAKFVEETQPIIEDEQVPESGDVNDSPESSEQSENTEQDETISDASVPLDALPQTGGIPLGLLMSAGFALATGGIMVKKPRRKVKPQ